MQFLGGNKDATAVLQLLAVGTETLFSKDYSLTGSNKKIMKHLLFDFAASEAL